MLTQARWRAFGAIALTISGAMMTYAVSTDFLRESILHLSALLSSEAAPNTVGGGWFHAVFWIFFGLLVGATFYCALLDLRFIRLQYQIERREIFRRTLGDEEFRAKLIAAERGENSRKQD